MRKITFLLALLCVSVMGFATTYCHSEQVDQNGNHYFITIKKVVDNTYSVIVEGSSTATITGTYNVNCGMSGGIDMTNGTWIFDNSGYGKLTRTFEYASTPGVVGANDLTMQKSTATGTGDLLYAKLPTDADWNATCDDEEPSPELSLNATFTISEVWPTDRVTAVKNGDNFDVNIATYGGNQWQAQVKLLHNIDFAATKSYKVAFDLTADQDCGGITFKTDNNTGSVYEYPINGLVASTPYHYEKVFSGQAGNDKIMVFDFGWVGNNTNITISNLTLVEYSPATASSTNGDLIPFKAVDGNTGTRWQAASKGEAWWKMDYGTSQSFNRVNITWENSYAKSFTIQGSNDDESYTTLATVSGQTISGFPYKQVIDLDQLYNYRYVKFVGTENGNDYGFSFYEFEIMEVETSVLTSVAITSPRRKTVCPISSSIDITAEARDQYDMPMGGQTITYSVSPASAGTIDANGHYTASQVGEATITASCSDKQASYVVVNTISANLALNKPATAGANETPIAEANDANLNSYWALGPNRPVDEMWWRVDLEETYDLSLVIIKWEGACPTEHAIQVSSDDANWTDVATLSGWPVIGGNDDHNYQFYSINAQGRYIRVKASALRDAGWGMKIYDIQAFGTLAASPTKSVSATPNDALMGSASVTQNDAPVTEVTTGSTVTFSAEANDGYVFVDWSNGETRATFDAEVNSNMNLTANFRALGTIYCNTEMTASGHTIYVTLKKSGENEYKLIVNSTEELSNFGGTVMYKPDNTQVKDLRNQGVLSNGNHTLTGTMTSDRDIYFGTPLYVVFAGVGEITYSVDQGVANTPEFAVPCADAVTTGVALSQTSANLLLGSTLTLTPSFTPAYATDRALTWETSNPSIATVDGGVVTPVATGSVTITAKLTSNNSVYATCNVTVVDALTPATWYGYSTIQPQEGFTAYTYSITRNANQTLTFTMTTDKNIVGYVSGITGDVTGSFSGYTAETHSGSFTTEGTYTDNDPLNLQLTFASANYGATPLAISYRVGSSNDALGQAIAIDESIDNTTILTTYDGRTVVGVLGRSFTAGNLYTLVLPFNVDAAQTAAKLPGQLTKLNNTYVKDNGDLRINFVDASAIEAGVPYLYKPSAAVANPTFEGVEVTAALNPTVADSHAEYHGIYAPMDGDALHAKTNAYVLGPDQYLYAVSDLPDNQTMAALRAYFVLNFPPAGPGAPKRLAKVVFNENETETTTDYENLQTDNTCIKVIVNGQLQIIRDGKTYNAFGQLVK